MPECSQCYENWVCYNCAHGVTERETKIEHQEQIQSLNAEIASLKQKIQDKLLALLNDGPLTADQIVQVLNEQA